MHVSRYETSKHLWLVLEYCVGGDLLALLRKDQQLPEDSVHDFARGLVASLQYCHSKVGWEKLFSVSDDWQQQGNGRRSISSRWRLKTCIRYHCVIAAATVAAAEALLVAAVACMPSASL